MTKNIKAAVVIIKNEQDEFLLLQRSQEAPHHPGKWENVGGKLDPEDKGDFKKAGRREAMEEAGVEIGEMTELFRKIFPDKQQGVDFDSMILEAKVLPGQVPRITEDAIFSNIGWFAREAIQSMDLAEYTREDYERTDVIEELQ